MPGGQNPPSLRRQLVALTGALSAFVALGLVVVVQVVLAGASTDAVTRVLQDRADSVISSAQAGSGSLSVPDARLDPGVAVYDDAGTRVAGTVPPSLREEFARLSGTTSEQAAEVGESYQVLAQRFTLDDGTAGVVVLAEPLQPYENDEHAALVVSLSAGAVMVLLGIALAAWISRRALGPVEQMALTASEWSEHDLERRFDLGLPTDEIRALGHTLDDLLDKVATAIRAEQRLTSELAHELRTPLTAVQATAELMAMRDDLDDQLREDVEDILSAARSMASTMTVLLEIARRQASDEPGQYGEHGEVCSAADLSAALASQFAEGPYDGHGPTLDLPAGLLLQAPPAVVLRALTPLLENALALAEHVQLSARADGRFVALEVCDDGPGVAPAMVERLFEPGASTGSSGLGLSLARRVARSVGGDVALGGHEGRGATFVLRLPGRIS